MVRLRSWAVKRGEVAELSSQCRSIEVNIAATSTGARANTPCLNFAF
jgi:hypothetical protein